jgi:heterodisulfide reductase subunit A-like polyferredoxin/coenzyme F420-reducing hydrogenase delta subunit
MRTGLFLSRHDGAISETVDVDFLAESFSNLSAAKSYDSFFNYPDQEDMIKIVNQHGLDSIILAGNSPQYFRKFPGGSHLLDTFIKQGINENKIGFANLNEQVAMIHKGEREKATQKARLLIEAALVKLKTSAQIKSIVVTPRRAVLIVGSDSAAILAAWELLSKGYRVYMSEKGSSLQIVANPEENVLPAWAAVQSNDRFKVFRQAELVDISGYAGQYKIVLNTPDGREEISVGGIILSLGPDVQGIKKLKTKLRFSTDGDGFFAQDTLVSGQTNDQGIWFLPGRNGNNSWSERIGGVNSAVLSLTALLDADEIAHPLLISEVNENICGGCGTCVKTCAFGASRIDLARHLSVIDPERCKGCGNCVTSCPTSARDLVSYPRKYISKAITLLSRGIESAGDPRILAILCKNCGYTAFDQAGTILNKSTEKKLPINVMPLLLECGGAVDTQYIMEAFKAGFDGVALFICRDGNCQNAVGNTDMQRRLGLFREVLRSRDIQDERLRVVPVDCHEGQDVIQELQGLSEELKEMQTKAEGGRGNG